jgi:hypothetical protein
VNKQEEINGYVVVMLLNSTWEVTTFGPWPTRREATNAMVRLKNKHKNHQEVNHFRIRPLIKGEYA